jgi:hypothetical protein
MHDIFISHAFEDKESIANELALELTKAGLKVWYSGFELKLGDSIAGSINKALKDAAFGVVVISPIYLQKQWAMNELNALFAQEGGQNRILPILHNITVDEIRAHFPILADRYTISSDRGMNFMVSKILQAMAGIKTQKPTSTAEQFAHTKNPETKRRTGEERTTIVNNNTNNVTTGSGGKVLLMIVLLIIIVALYFMSAEPGDDAGSHPGPKEQLFPSNAN